VAHLIGLFFAKITIQFILKRASLFDNVNNGNIPNFTYQSSNDTALVNLRRKYNLDSVAGFGNTESRILNLLHWVHNTVRHDGQNPSGIKNSNANEILTAAITKGIGVSCGELATTLNDVYLAMGYYTRKVYCFPKDSLKTDMDSHVLNAVFISSKNKWIWVDPTNDAYVMNEKGELLSVTEVRERLISGKSLIVNPDANWNRRTSMTKDYYLDIYMAKNLYRFYSPLKSEYDYETMTTGKTITYVHLFPLDYKKVHSSLEKKDNTPASKIKIITYNSGLFWAAPKDE
jgi:hypothetical protein